jgi:exopolysaccharide biosynthesis polyprenyl glycosylphosphotransferase
MIKEKEKFFENILMFLYVLTTILSFFWVYSVFLNPEIKSLLCSNEYSFLLLNIIIVWYILFSLFRLTKFHRLRNISSIFFDHVVVEILGIVIISVVIVIFKLEDISRIVLFLFAILNLCCLFAGRYAVNLLVKVYRSKGYNTSNLLIIADDDSDEIIQEIILNKFWGYKIKVIITDSELITAKYIMEYAVLPSNTNIDKFIELETIDEVIYCKINQNYEELNHLIFSCQEIGVSFHLVSRLNKLLASKSHITYFGNLSFYSFYKSTFDYVKLKLKLLVDYIFSFISLLLFSPFFLIIVILIKLSSKGPIIFKQKRVGLHGRIFNFYKFRTMVNNAEELKSELMKYNEQSGPVFKLKHDPRITKIGRFLRKTSLDEFPQFINVLKGDMSIVGPRPPIPDEVKQYKRWQLRRLSMKPGITCIWQVSGRNRITFDDWMKMDLEYIDNWSPKLDIILFLKTVKTVLSHNGQ